VSLAVEVAEWPLLTLSNGVSVRFDSGATDGVTVPAGELFFRGSIFLPWILSSLLRMSTSLGVAASG